LRYLVKVCGSKFEKCDIDKFLKNPNSLTKEFVDKEKIMTLKELNFLKDSKVKQEEALHILQREEERFKRNTEELKAKYRIQMELMKNLNEQVQTYQSRLVKVKEQLASASDKNKKIQSLRASKSNEIMKNYKFKETVLKGKNFF